jgi:hypothetical protein
MTAQAFRIARDRVAGKPPDATAWLAIENIYDELTLPHRSDGRFETLTEGQKAVYVLHWVQSEIRNGAFEQLYFNSTGRFAALAPAAAREVGADEYAAVFARARTVSWSRAAKSQSSKGSAGKRSTMFLLSAVTSSRPSRTTSSRCSFRRTSTSSWAGTSWRPPGLLPGVAPRSGSYHSETWGTCAAHVWPM